MPDKQVILRTGETVPELVFKPVMTALEYLDARNRIALYELISACHNPDHVVLECTIGTLKQCNLIDRVDAEGHTRVYEPRRHVVLAATEATTHGGWVLVPPIADS